MLELIFAGDISLANIDTESFSFSSGIIELFNASDIKIANLEAPLTFSENKTPDQAWYMKADPADSEIINLFDIYSLANNHILDYRIEGLDDTTGFLKRNNKGWFGIGKDTDDSFRPLILEKKGIKLALWGFTHWYNARKNAHGTTPKDYGRLRRSIKRYREENYFIILFPHWNYEYNDYPAPLERRQAHRLIESGADIIIGSHPHNIQGYEIYKGRHIYHSLGNFIFHSSQFSHLNLDDERLNQTFIVKVLIDKDLDYEVEIIPIYSTDTGMVMMGGNEEEEFFKKFESISNILNTNQYPDVFYSQARNIVHKTMKAIRRTSSRNSVFWGTVKRLHRIRTQDLLIMLHSYKYRK